MHSTEEYLGMAVCTCRGTCIVQAQTDHMTNPLANVCDVRTMESLHRTMTMQRSVGCSMYSILVSHIHVLLGKWQMADSYF